MTRVHLAEQKLERSPDPDIVVKALQEGRILLVHDLGFGELVAASGTTLPSVITFRLRNMHPDRVNRALDRILSQHGGILEQGAIISITEGQVRVRSLPLTTPSSPSNRAPTSSRFSRRTRRR